MSITRTNGEQGATGPEGPPGPGGIGMTRGFGDSAEVPVDTETILVTITPTGTGGAIHLEAIVEFQTTVPGSASDTSGAIEIVLRCYQGTTTSDPQLSGAWELSLSSLLESSFVNMSAAWSDGAITGDQPYTLTIQYASLGVDSGFATKSMLEAWVSS